MLVVHTATSFVTVGASQAFAMSAICTAHIGKMLMPPRNAGRLIMYFLARVVMQMLRYTDSPPALLPKEFSAETSGWTS